MSSSIVNPRALFDPNYVPPELLHRDKELKNLLSIFNSSLDPNDPFSINTYIYGIRGIGKSTLVNYLINVLKSSCEGRFNHIYMNLAIKSPLENLRLLVELFSQLVSKNFTFLSNTQQLWSYFHFLRKKSDIPLILTLDNLNHLNQPLFKKIIRYSKDLNISTIVTSRIPMNNYEKNSKMIAESMDFPQKLNIFTSSALLDILSQRIELAFPVSLEPALSRYIVDIVTQFDHYRPSTCIGILKSLYKHIINGEDISSNLIREASIHLLEFPYQGDLSCLLQFDDSIIDLFYLPLLEKIAIYFKNRAEVYISQNELYKLYKVTCDELFLPYNQNQYKIFIDRLVLDGFLYPSCFKSKENKPIYFMILNPNRLLEYLEIKYTTMNV